MNFSKQDAVTFLVGAAAALAVTLATAFIDTDALLANPSLWLTNLGVGLLGALGRYLLTELAQTRVRRREDLLNDELTKMIQERNALRYELARRTGQETRY